MRPYAEAGRKTGSKRYLARRTRVGFEFQQVGGIENRLRTVWCRNSSRKIRGFIYSPWSLSRGIAHAERRLETRKFKIPTAIRSDGKGDLCKPEQGRRLARTR